MPEVYPNSLVHIRELFEYDRTVRHRFLEVLARLPWAELIKNREASYHSLRNIFLHCLAVEEHLVQRFARGQRDPWPRIDFEAFEEWSMIKAWVQRVEAETDAFLTQLSEEALDHIVGFRRSCGEILPLTVEDVLLQCLTEQLYHRGELIALLWQMDVEPPPMQWFLNLPAARAARLARERAGDV